MENISLEKAIKLCGVPVFDFILPRVLTGEILSRRDFTTLGVGGLL